MKFLRKFAGGLAPRRDWVGANGARAYAIGDVHGRLDLLDDLLARISADDAARPARKTYLISLGDLIDRGPESAGVIERLRTFADFPTQVVGLLGNHEEILLRVLDAEPGLAYDWLSFGGDACLASYGVDAKALEAASEARIAEVAAAAIPTAHLAFLKTFGDTFSFGDYLFVHAGIRPGVALDRQQEYDLRWIRGDFLNDTKDHGMMVVHGHTVSNAVDERSNRIGIDTGAYQTGILTAIGIEGDARWFLATERSVA